MFAVRCKSKTLVCNHSAYFDPAQICSTGAVVDLRCRNRLLDSSKSHLNG